MSDVFISYSRRDGEFARYLHTQLVDRHERDVWIDWEDIPPTADWWDEITAAIESSDAFAFIISPDSVRSDVCRQEIQHAIDNNKRFIPLLYRAVADVDSPMVHPAIRTHNWIDFSDESAYAGGVAKLMHALSTEPEYLRRHTRLLVRARDWQQNGQNPAYLLTGNELAEFQKWLRDSETREPKPTELQYNYILASQNGQARRRLTVGLSAAAALVIFVVLGAAALVFSAESRAAETELQALQQEQSRLQTQARANNQTQIADAYQRGTQVALVTENAGLLATIDTLQLAFREQGDDDWPATEAAESVPATATSAAVAQANRETIRVAPNGSDTSTCGDVYTACASISHALTFNPQQIDVAPGVYGEQLLITTQMNPDLTIIGSGTGVTLLTNNYVGRVLEVTEGASVRIAGLTITGGAAPVGGGVLNRGELRLSIVDVTGNDASERGGGIANFGALYLDEVALLDNYAPEAPGLFNAPDASITVDELRAGDTAELTQDQPLSAEAGYQSDLLADLPELTRVELLDPPVEQDGAIWWRVRVLDSSNRTGWIVGNEQGVPFLDNINRD